MDTSNNMVFFSTESLLGTGADSATARKEANAFKNMKSVRKANKSIGHFFFDRNNMKFWDTKVETPLYRGRYFVTSEAQRPPKEGRGYQVHEVLDSGVILNVGYKLDSLDDAKEEIKNLVRMTPNR